MGTAGFPIPFLLPGADKERAPPVINGTGLGRYSHRLALGGVYSAMTLTVLRLRGPLVSKTTLPGALANRV